MSQKKNKPNTNQHRSHNNPQTASQQNVRLVQNNKPAASSVTETAAKTAQAAADTQQKTVQAAAETQQKAAHSVAKTAEKTAEKTTQAVKAATPSPAKAEKAVEKTLEKSISTMKNAAANQQNRWEALAESCKVATDVQQEFQTDLQKEVNEMLQEQVELTRKFFGCRQINDFVELQNQALKCHIKHSIDLTAKMAEAWFKLATDAVEPLQEVNKKSAKSRGV